MKPKEHIISIFIPHAGCENTCVFCNQKKITGTDDSNTFEIIKAAAESFSDPGKPVQIAFYGGSFTAIPLERQKTLLAAVQPFLAEDRSRSVRISTRPDYISDEIVERLKSFGVRTIELGAQSMCDDVLLQSKRGHTAADVEAASGVIKKAGVSLVLQMMTGLPGDTFEKSLYTARRFITLQPDGVRIYPTVVVKETELFQMWQDGCYKEHTVEEAVVLCAEICALFGEADIPVIRLGLNPTRELSEGGAAAGAYHPAFGALVYSKIYYDKTAELLKDIPSQSNVTLTVGKGRTSLLVGQNRSNIKRLMSEFLLESVKIKESEAINKPFSVQISCN